MKSNEILYSNGNNDECHTPDYAVIPIMEYIPKDAVVWCPFDTQDSRFVKEIAKTNQVEFSHINNGQDFYKYEPKTWDIIISNPPYTNKRKIFERCLAFNKPFALLMSNTWLNDSAPKQLFMQKDLQVSRNTATKYLDDIVKIGLLEKVKKGKENYYVNVNLMSLFVSQGEYNNVVDTIVTTI
jgi:hypothetical protein